MRSISKTISPLESKVLITCIPMISLESLPNFIIKKSYPQRFISHSQVGFMWGGAPYKALISSLSSGSTFSPKFLFHFIHMCTKPILQQMSRRSGEVIKIPWESWTVWKGSPQKQIVVSNYPFPLLENSSFRR